MIYAFGDCELDTDLYELRRGGRPRQVEPQVFDVLCHLVANRGRVVAKEELLDAVWGDRFVSESALSSRIRDARRAVGDDGTAQRAIRTVHGRGFRFVADVEERTPAPAATPTGGGEHTRPPPGGRSPGQGAPGPAQAVRFCRAADGTRLAYATAGAGPLLVKAPNWLTHLRADWESVVWRHWLRELSARYRLVHHDARASGLSDWDVAEVSFEAMVGDLEAVVDAAGLDRFALLGVSQGGAVATAYAARHPERVTHLVLYGAYALGRRERARTAQGRREAELMLDLVEAVWAREASQFRHLFAAQFMLEATPWQWAAFEAHQRDTASPENARRLLGMAASIDVTDVAPAVRAPTLVLHAVDDRRVPVAQGELLASLIPGARFVPLASCNHLLLDSEPAWDAFLAVLDEHLATPATSS